MSVRDRIANMNISKAPIITTVASSNTSISTQIGKSNRTDSTSSNTSSTETVDKDSSDVEGSGVKKTSTIAERIAKLKAGQAPVPAESTVTANEPSAKSSISSRIALLGANINVASLSPGDPGKPKQFNPFSPPTSRVQSNANSRENTSDNCLTNTDLQEGSDNRSFIGTTVKTNNSVPGEMIHLTMERPSRPSRSRGKAAVVASVPL